MALRFVDTVTCLMRSVDRAVSSMSGIELRELPSVEKIKVAAMTIFAPPDTFTSLIPFKVPGQARSQGVVAVYISKSSVKTLFGRNFGLDAKSSESEIQDAAGELCNIITGGFKREVVVLGEGEIEVGMPQNFAGLIQESVDMDVAYKYRFSFSQDEVDFMTMDFAMESA